MVSEMSVQVKCRFPLKNMILQRNFIQFEYSHVKKCEIIKC